LEDLMADEGDLLDRIRELVDAEHALRERRGRDELSSDEERSQLAALEVQLDQCWDLLRQRRARAAAGLDPDEARVRPADEVEGYLS
jgi:hypothetical protein